MRRWACATEEETRELGSSLARELGRDGILLLEGNLGAGKTALTKGVGAALGIDPADVQSPTFTLVREHRGPAGVLRHLDLYRLGPREVEELGIDESINRP